MEDTEISAEAEADVEESITSTAAIDANVLQNIAVTVSLEVG